MLASVWAQFPKWLDLGILGIPGCIAAHLSMSAQALPAEVERLLGLSGLGKQGKV
jgi:hypothetical protein